MDSNSTLLKTSTYYNYIKIDNGCQNYTLQQKITILKDCKKLGKQWK